MQGTAAERRRAFCSPNPPSRRRGAPPDTAPRSAPAGRTPRSRLSASVSVGSSHRRRTFAPTFVYSWSCLLDEPPLPAPVRVHHVYLLVPVPVGLEGDVPAVGRGDGVKIRE